MSTDLTYLEPIWSQFSDVCRPTSIESLGNCGGFSGARIWRTDTPVGRLCLRAWPAEQPSERQLKFMHATLRRVRGQGLTFVPAPMRTRDGETILRFDGGFWELTPWMPGVADFHARPTPERLRAAMQALARFHLAAASADSPDPVGPSPTLRRRLRELSSFLNGPDAEKLHRQVPNGRWPEMDVRAERLLEHVESRRSYLNDLLELTLPSVTQQPVIRDIWHDHVLFDGDAVSGMIDYGAMSIDTVAVDVSRLLGSLVDGDADAWNAGLRAYCEIRPLSMEQRDLLETLDKTGVFAGGLVWLRWHYLENRTFENPAGVLARVDHFLNRLELSDTAGRRMPRFTATLIS
jgi:homoserine kinase type II